MLVPVQADIIARCFAFNLTAQCCFSPSGEPYRGAVGVNDLVENDKSTASRTLTVRVRLYNDGGTVMLKLAFCS